MVTNKLSMKQCAKFQQQLYGILRMSTTLSAAKEFRVVQKKVAELIKGRILVGHALRNDLKVNVPSFPVFSYIITVA